MIIYTYTYIFLLSHIPTYNSLNWADYKREIEETKNPIKLLLPDSIISPNNSSSKADNLVKTDIKYTVHPNKLLDLYVSLSNPDIERCADPTFLLPECNTIAPKSKAS